MALTELFATKTNPIGMKPTRSVALLWLKLVLNRSMGCPAPVTGV